MVAVEERFSNIEGLALYDAQRRLRRKSYSIDKVLDHTLFAIEDLTFNCIFIRANELLEKIAKVIDEELPEELVSDIKRSRESLEQVWDPHAGQYFSRDFITHRLIREPSIATLMPLYAGNISNERAEQLVNLIENPKVFGLPFPIPSVPGNSPWYKPKNYWQGPTWVNTNWLIIDGLKRYGYKELADKIAAKSIELVEKNGFYEYFSALDGDKAGTNNFSWSAALTIDLLSNKKK
jgi:neutral trehalase